MSRCTTSSSTSRGSNGSSPCRDPRSAAAAPGRRFDIVSAFGVTFNFANGPEGLSWTADDWMRALEGFIGVARPRRQGRHPLQSGSPYRSTVSVRPAPSALRRSARSRCPLLRRALDRRADRYHQPVESAQVTPLGPGAPKPDPAEDPMTDQIAAPTLHLHRLHRHPEQGSHARPSLRESPVADVS